MEKFKKQVIKKKKRKKENSSLQKYQIILYCRIIQR